MDVNLIVRPACVIQLWCRALRLLRSNQPRCPGARTRDEKIPPVHSPAVTALSASRRVKSLIIHLSSAVLANVGVVSTGVKQTGPRRGARSPVSEVPDCLS